MVKKRKTMRRRRSSSKKPIGYTRTKGKYALVFGTKKRPKLGSGRYKTKKNMLRAVAKKRFKT